MAFTGWGRRCELVIQSSQVDQDCTDFPVLVHEDSLPSEIFDADGSYPALNGGGDLRFSTDQAGDSQIPCEIESFVTDNDPANGKAAVWVKRTLSSASNTSIWIYYFKAGESQPAETDAYGKHAVWDSNFVMVQHMAETPPGTIVDSTSNSNDGTTYNMDSADQVAGQIDGSLDFDGADDYVATSYYIPGGSSPFSVAFWFNTNNNDVSQEVIGQWDNINDKIFRFSIDAVADKSLGFRVREDGAINSDISTPINSSQWYHVVGTFDGTNTELFLGGTSKGTNNPGTLQTGTSDTPVYLGVYGASLILYFNGIIDEVRISNTARSSGWIATEYNNQSAPGTFLVEGTPQTPGAGITIPIFMHNMRGGYNLMSRGGFIN